MFQRFGNRQRRQSYVVMRTHWKIWSITLMGKVIVT